MKYFYVYKVTMEELEGMLHSSYNKGDYREAVRISEILQNITNINDRIPTGILLGELPREIQSKIQTEVYRNVDEQLKRIREGKERVMGRDDRISGANAMILKDLIYAEDQIEVAQDRVIIFIEG